MSDVTIAPSGSAPAVPSAPSQVPINQNPVDSPNPIGPQSPPAPTEDFKGSEHRTPSRREAIQAAFERANNPQSKHLKTAERAPQPAAEAKKGHNQPPEETPNEKLDLRKRPGDQPRSERGQFAPRAKDTEEQTQKEGLNSPFRQAGTNANETAPAATGNFREPPPRMAEHAKRDWAAAPESVRGEVYRMHHEYEKAYQTYRGAYEAMRPIAHFHQMATQHGTTLEKALTNYVGIEQKLRTDPIAGLDIIVHNLGLTDPQTGQRLGLRDIAYSVLSQSPEQLRQLQQGNQQQAASYQIGALHQRLDGIENFQRQMHSQQRFDYTRSAVDQFADTHPRFDELSTVIRAEIDLGFDLDTAYRRADLLRPATQAAQTRTTPSAQTRIPDRSIHGSPDVAPSDGASRRPKEASASPRDAVRNAMVRFNGHA